MQHENRTTAIEKVIALELIFITVVYLAFAVGATTIGTFSIATMFALVSVIAGVSVVMMMNNSKKR